MIANQRKKGRPKGSTGSGKYGEPTVPIRVPLRLVKVVNELLKKEVKK